MGPANCAVIGCSNSTQKLKKWKEDHADKCAEMICCCDPPFRLYMFLSIKRNSEKRKQWVQLTKRQTVDRKPWLPRGSDRVCSNHFIDGEPTVKNPNPTLDLGYQDTATAGPRRVIVKQPLKEASSKKKIEFKSTSTPGKTSIDSSFMSPPASPKTPVVCDIQFQSPVLSVHNYSMSSPTETCKSCVVKGALIKNCVSKIRQLNQQVKKLKNTVNRLTQRREDRQSFFLRNTFKPMQK